MSFHYDFIRFVHLDYSGTFQSSCGPAGSVNVLHSLITFFIQTLIYSLHVIFSDNVIFLPLAKL